MSINKIILAKNIQSIYYYLGESQKIKFCKF